METVFMFWFLYRLVSELFDLKGMKKYDFYDETMWYADNYILTIDKHWSKS